jgi:hypothetical protein
MKQIIAGMACGAFLAVSLPALAEHREIHWEGHETHILGEHDLGIWRGGHWFHGPHEGRPGWWWVVGDVWYFYPVPVYPYPDPYAPLVVSVPDQPPVLVAPQAPATAPLPPQPAAQSWYYCDSAKTYYPYVSACPEGWKTVPMQPPQPGPR